MSTIFKPNGERVLIKEMKTEEKKTTGGIIMPTDNAQKMSFMAEVVAMGNVFNAEMIKELGFEGGDKVEVRNMMHDEITLDGESFKCVPLDSIIGVYSESADQV